MKKYREIEFSLGSEIDSAIKELKSYKELVCGTFNGHKLYSDIDCVQTAYKKVTGSTKSEFDVERKIENDKYQKEKEDRKNNIPKLTENWIDKGNQILDDKYHSLWAECVPIRLKDLYNGMELQMCLDIVLELNSGCTLDKAKEIIESQGHSGMSFGLVCLMVKSFCNRGVEFVTYVKP